MGQSAAFAAYCRKCDYALAGLPPKHICPECGRPFDLRDPTSIRFSPRPRPWRLIRWMAYPILFAALVIAATTGWAWWDWHREQDLIRWATRTPGSWKLGTRNVGPAWMRRYSGFWDYRADFLVAEFNQPVTPQQVPLSRARYLTALWLVGRGVGDDLMGEVGRLKELSELRLWDTSVTDAGLSRLNNCRNLQKLYLLGTSVGDQALAPLANHPQLTELDLRRTPVDNRALPVLKNLKNLTTLKLTGTKLTADAIADLHAALPRCSITP